MTLRGFTTILVACAATVLLSDGAAHARRHRGNPQPAPVANEAAPPAASAAAPEAALAYAPPAPAPGLTGLLDSIFKPQAAAVTPPQPLADGASPAVAELPADDRPSDRTQVVRTGPLHDLVVKHAAANGVPFPLAHAVIMLESKYAARVAHAGNYGLMQIRAQTARGLGFSGSASGLLDPDTNLRFGMKYLALAYRMAHGDTCGALMRYQSGVGTIRMSASNRAYCARARTYMAHM